MGISIKCLQFYIFSILRMQERTRTQQQAAVQIEQQAVVEVNPEFLAALPPNIQEEVLAQQRIEQQRQAAAAANPNDPVDAAAFFQNLQPSLRQAILTDMEDSQISVLPPELAAEAQNLRRDWESRNRQIMQEQINQIGSNSNATNAGSGPSPSFSSVLRYRSRLPEPIFSAQNLHRMRWSNWGINAGANTGEGGSGNISRDLIASGGSNILADLRMEQQGRPLLDHESLSSLLILLFVEANKICTLRFHRVIRNLCYHIPTRDWIIRTILSIIEKSNVQPNTHDELIAVGNRPHWLNIRLDAALGNRNNVFIIQKTQRPKEAGGADAYDYSITIHPQASQIVCRHALDLLIALAKNFPANFLPIKKSIAQAKKEKCATASRPDDQPGTSASTSDSCKAEKSTEFWDILLRLELKVQQRKNSNKSNVPTSQSTNPHDFKEVEVTSFSDSPFGQLISMLSLNIIVKNSLLTDKLLRLLSFISIGLPDAIQQSQAAAATNTTNQEAADRSVPSTSATAAGSGVEQATATVPSTTDSTNTKFNRLKPSVVQLDEKCLPESQDNLRLAIEVLTLKSCSEEGLEDATTLLLNLSQCSNVTRTFILKLLIDGAKYLANVVQMQINELIIDLRRLNKRNRTDLNSTLASSLPSSHQPGGQSMAALFDNISGNGSGGSSAFKTSSQENLSAHQSTSSGYPNKSTANKGILQDRFTKETVVITTTGKQKPRCELQLPSMVPLVSKTASQSFFLRILKVIIQIRETVKETVTKDEPAQASTEGTAEASADRLAESLSAVASGSSTSSAITNNLARSSKKVALHPAETQSLSKTLQLDHLWDTLSECLVELEENADHHAVLVLQPAVEAFFLVHATSSVSGTGKNKKPQEENVQPESRDGDAVIERTADNNESEDEDNTNDDAIEHGTYIYILIFFFLYIQYINRNFGECPSFTNTPTFQHPLFSVFRWRRLCPRSRCRCRCRCSVGSSNHFRQT